MGTFLWILTAAIGSGVLSVVAAAGFSMVVDARRTGLLISYAIGALLGASLLEVLPHALEHGSAQQISATLLFGLLAFFVLEKLVLWRHCHHKHCEVHEASAHTQEHGKSGLLIVVGDAFHNFVDGILIAAAFMDSTQLGIVTALAIVAHEIPQEIGDHLILLHSGYSRMRALVFNILSSLATLAGAVLAYFLLAGMTQWIPSLLALAAASMLYIAMADLIPGLHKRTDLKATAQQVLLMGLGIASIVLAQALSGGV